MNVIIKYFWIFFNFLVIIIFGSIQHDANTQKTTLLLLNTTYDAAVNFLKFCLIVTNRFCLLISPCLFEIYQLR